MVLKWILIALFGFGAVGTIWEIDQPRNRFTRQVAALVVVVDFLLIGALLHGSL
jgi:hypothetical protein